MDGSNNDDTMSCSFVRAIKRLDCPYKLAWHGIRHSFPKTKSKGMAWLYPSFAISFSFCKSPPLYPWRSKSTGSSFFLIFSRESDTPHPLPKNRNRLSRCENYTATKKEKKRAKKRGKNCMSSFLPPCFLAAASRNPHVNSPRHVS